MIIQSKTEMMLQFKIALRYILRRKFRMIAIGFLVFLGTVIMVLGETFAISARHFSRQSIINYFTGDCIIYSSRSKEKPSPFAFTTPLPVIENLESIDSWITGNPMVERRVAIAQNYGVLSVDHSGKSVEVPFIFYAVDPKSYLDVFPNIIVDKGHFYNTDSIGPSSGIVLSHFQLENYRKNYHIDPDVGTKATLLSLTDGGSVNAFKSSVIGIYKPNKFVNVFNYINFVDINTYSQLYNFTGVDSSSLPQSYNNALSSTSDDDIFGLADDKSFGPLSTANLVSARLSGYTQISIKLKNSNDLPEFMNQLYAQNFSVACAPWNQASSFFANIATIIESVIYGATFLIFLIVGFILMNTLIISILERTAEIGTLRAMGGEKSFITGIFLWEAFILNGTAALIGMLISAAVIFALRFTPGIALPDIVAQYLIGGGSLPLLLSVKPFLIAIVLVTIFSLLATVYPLKTATAITPLKAMNRK